MSLRFFHKDHVSIESLDIDTSIITIKCPTFLSADLLVLIDSLAQVARLTSTQCRMSRTSFINKKALRGS